MAAVTIGTTPLSGIGDSYMPSPSDPADIQAALKSLYYGSTGLPTTNGIYGALAYLKASPVFTGNVSVGGTLSITGATSFTGKVTIGSLGIVLPTATITDSGSLAWESTYKNISVGTGSTNLNIPTFAVNTTAKTAAYTLTAGDSNTIVQMNGAFAFSVPTNTVAFPIGTQIHLLALTSGVTVAALTPATTTVLSTPGAKLREETQWQH